MHKLLIYFFVLAALAACNPSDSKSKRSPATPGSVSDTPGPDASDLLQILQGRWQNLDEPDFALEILDTRMQHLKQGQLTLDANLEIDGSCLSVPCKMDSTNLQDGWCFIEKTKTGSQCYIVSACDKMNLQYNKVGDENAVFRFKKLP